MICQDYSYKNWENFKKNLFEQWKTAKKKRLEVAFYKGNGKIAAITTLKQLANPSTLCWLSLFLFYCVIKGQYFVQNKLFEGKRGCILFYPFFLFIYIYFPIYEITFPWPGLSMFLALSILFGFLNSLAALGKRICLFVRMSVDIKSKLQPNKHLNNVGIA